MDPIKSNEAPTINSSEEIGTSRPIVKGILKTSMTGVGRSNIDRSPVKRTSTTQIKRTTRVTFSDRAKNLPICTVFEVEAIKYEDDDSPRGKSCACLIF